MKLTRKILTEKSSIFYRCDNPHNIEECVWENTLNEIRTMNFDNNERLLYIITDILVPLFKANDYLVGKKKSAFFSYRECFFYKNNKTHKITIFAEDIKEIENIRFYTHFKLKNWICNAFFDLCDEYEQ